MDLKKIGFQLPDAIRFNEDTLTNTYGKLIAEPLERGFGTTLGNALRRVLLSSIEGAAVTAVKIPGAFHEFSTIKGVKEDVVEIILNIKKLRFKLYANAKKIATIKVKGPQNVTGSNIQGDASFEVLNPEQLIATLDKDATFEAEMYINKGKGYVPAELNKEENLPVDMIAVDSVFTPLKKVNFTVEKARVGRATDYDRLVMEIWTDGSITPEKAISQAASIVIEHLKLFVLEEEQEEEENISIEESNLVYSASEDPIFNVNLLKSLEELELSVRSYNCLMNADIKTIADLVQKTEQEILRTKNFGRKSLNEIKEILYGMGLRLGMRVDMEALNREVALQSGGIEQNAAQD
ncbi:MAG: DNA-directed RNA polymerase subunit alpha [Nitrospirae bacterium]|nr:DNA-directed RNA polymerase subunit alpha [Nitrospirota bacterium]OIP60617.1 MAG: DNA-directed RNA polymerase subunit alpha [Nitrospirae bacterium CG2_30_41_42]PIQ95013.1 MAG: DNA-directed RNA polymerase subunit alpha [Nitrospirae bacterium CG11_big_fil_rev_8_21_14_0_20_41_14]PIW87163.1 MAG: DNA-directed RNA polymerase subunit alpha [Nitrospirae bacterium CG_4_8_14_3_um_filter_41_47]